MPPGFNPWSLFASAPPSHPALPDTHTQPPADSLSPPPPPPPRQARRPVQTRLQHLLAQPAGGAPVEEAPIEMADLSKVARRPDADHRSAALLPAGPEAGGSALPPPVEAEVPLLRRRPSVNTRLRQLLTAGPEGGRRGNGPETPERTALARRHQRPDHRIATLDGAGFALTAGRLFSWNNGTDSWDRMPQRDVASIRLGGDGHAYARGAGNQLLCLTGPRAGSALPLAAGPIFAASPTGRIASLADGAQPAGGAAGTGGQTGILLSEPPSPNRRADRTLPLPQLADAPRELAFSSDGCLHMLTTGGDVWRLGGDDVEQGNAAGWQRLPRAPGAPPTSLLTLPNGAIAVGDDGGANQHLLEKNGTWTAHTDATASGLQRTYGQFRDSQQKFTNVTLGSPFTPGAARSDKKNVNWLQSKLAVFTPEQAIQVAPRGTAALTMVGQTTELVARYLNYFRAHYLPGPATPAPGQPPLHTQLRQDYQELRDLPLTTTPPAVPLTDAIHDAMNTNSGVALDRLERALGMTDAQGQLKPNWRDSAAIRAAQARRPGGAATDDNMLHLLVRRRQAMPPTGDADAVRAFADTTRRLQRLVQAGVHLHRPLAPNASREAMGYMALPARIWDDATDVVNGMGQPANQGLDILVGHLVKDQLRYETALQRTAPTRADSETDLRRLNGDDGNVVSQRFKQNIWDARAEVVFDSMRAVMGAFGQPDHVLNRAARFQGVLGEDKQNDYVRLVDELPPGESIRFEYTAQGGLDGDGWSHNWTPADRFKEGAHPKVDTPADLAGRFNIALNKKPNILPVPGASLARTRAMTISKRADGIDITFSHAFEGEVKLLCAKIKWGAGEYKANHRTTADGKDSHSALGLVFFGLEIVPAALVFSKGTEDSVKLSLKNDDAGTVSHVVESLLSGRYTPEELIEHTADASYTRSKHSKWSNTLDMQVLMAVVGIFTPPEKLSERFKMVIAGVEQWTASLNFSNSESRTQDASGVSTTRSGYDATAGLNRKFISVTEIQGSWIKALPAVSTLEGKTDNIIIGDGYEMEHKVPTWIDLQIMEVFAPKALHRTPAIQQSADGTVTGMRYTISSKDGLIFEALPHWEELARRSPEIADNLRGAAALAHAQGLPVDIEMELVPERLEMLDHARRSDDPDLSRAVSDVMRYPESWRIKQLRVGGREQYSTALVAGASMFRYRSHAGNIHQSNAALIDISYDPRSRHPAKPLRATVRGPLTNGGGQPKFDQLDALASGRFIDAAYGVSEEPRSGPRRRLAALPAHGPDAIGLADLSNKWLKAPRPEPHLALHQGRPVLQFRLPDNRWQHVALSPEEVGRLLGEQRGEATSALLQLMQAGASGRLEIPLGTWGQLKDVTDRPLTQPHPSEPDTGRAHERPLGIAGLLADAEWLERAIQQDTLDPAQRHVLRAFFPGEQWETECVEFAENPAMVAALGHALSQLVNAPPAVSAGHATPAVEVLTERPSAAAMMPSSAMASASG
ncbi:hypothetical protein ACEN9F_11345 [Duganella sp. CT11-25]|uniref:hypothetical protein n=1 Tax=unclassified Duganella TaxID=2636909 RepID=UPI0039B0E379